MIQKKICMLGSFAVGKTSLINRFVRSIFTEKYLTTVGVKIDRKEIRTDGQDINLVLWDLHGDDEYQRVRVAYMRGAGGYFLVADGTRRSTLDHALVLHNDAVAHIGSVPFLLLLNKADLADDWEIEDHEIQELVDQGWQILKTSAKTADNVEEAFKSLARQMIQSQPDPPG